MHSLLDEERVDEAALRLAIESRSLLGLPDDATGCRAGWIQRLTEPPDALSFARHLYKHVPLLMDGCIADHQGLRRWESTEYLITAMGDKQVQVAITPNGRADDLHILESGGKQVFALPAEVPMTFAELFASLREANRSPRPDSIAYLQSQNSNLTSTGEGGSGDLSALLRDVRQTPSEASSGSYAWADAAIGGRPEATNLWIGTSKSRTSMHRDHYENLFTVIRGTKTFTLYPPCEAYYLCEEEPFDVYQWTKGADGRWNLNPSDSPPTPWIPIDPTEPATSKRNAPHSRFAKALPPLVVNVQAGQTIYLPAGWFHHVGQEGDDEGFCICVNWWYDSTYAFSDRWALELFVKEIGTLSRGKEPSL